MRECSKCNSIIAIPSLAYESLMISRKRRARPEKIHQSLINSRLFFFVLGGVGSRSNHKSLELATSYQSG